MYPTGFPSCCQANRTCSSRGQDAFTRAVAALSYSAPELDDEILCSLGRFASVACGGDHDHDHHHRTADAGGVDAGGDFGADVYIAGMERWVRTGSFGLR